MENKLNEMHQFGAPKDFLKKITSLVKAKKINVNEASDYVNEYVFEFTCEILNDININPKLVVGLARQIVENWFASIDMVNKNLLQSDDEIRDFVNNELKKLNSKKGKEERAKKIEKIKSKKIKDMTLEELQYIIENDESLVPSERIKFTVEILKKEQGK